MWQTCLMIAKNMRAARAIPVRWLLTLVIEIDTAVMVIIFIFISQYECSYEN